MVKQSVTPEEVVRVLNEALTLDPLAIQYLMDTRVKCNRDMAEHEAIQVLPVGPRENPTEFRVGLMGLLNGLFGADENGTGPISAIYSMPDIKPSTKSYFSRVVGFCLTKDAKATKKKNQATTAR